MVMMTEDVDLPGLVSPSDYARIIVQISIVDENSRPIVAFHTATSKTIASPWEFAIDADGTWEKDLPPTSELTPVGVVFERRLKGPHFEFIHYFDVPDVAGPENIQDHLTDPPEALTSSALALHIADSDAHAQVTEIDDLPDSNVPFVGNELAAVLQAGIAVQAPVGRFSAPGLVATGFNRQHKRHFDDLDNFTTTVTTNGAFVGPALRANLSGAAAQIAQGATLGEFGVADVSTGTATTGRAGLEPPVPAFHLHNSGGYVDIGARVRMPAVSDGTNTYQVLMGFFVTTGGVAPTDGFFLRSPAAAGNWRAVIRDDSADVADVDSGIATDHGGVNWALLRVRFNPGIGFRFYVNGTLVHTVALESSIDILANIGQPGIHIIKTAGATARVLEVDAFSWDYFEADRKLEQIP